MKMRLPQITKLVMFFIGTIISIFLNAQNVGINTTTPTKELDVNGDMAISGVIVPSGQAGTTGQVLQIQSGGNMAWVDKSKYSNFKEFNDTSVTHVWSWPAGVTEVMVEMWGGGGAGRYAGGGGSGSYGLFIINKTTTNDLAIIVGQRSNSSINASFSQVTYGSTYCIAYGGEDADNNRPGLGGSGIAVSGANIQYFGLEGENGKQTKFIYSQSSATTYTEVIEFGDGANSPRIKGNGGTGGVTVDNGTTTLKKDIKPTPGRAAGGGGGGYTILVKDAWGAFGKVVLYW